MGIGEHAKTALWLGAGMLLFIICLSAGSRLFQTTTGINAKVYTLINTTDKNQQATLKMESDYTCTGAEVVQTLYQIQELNATVLVNGQRFDSSMDPDEMDVSHIDVNRTYHPTYVRDTQGRLTLLTYDAS
ncbi:hypothetical protein SK066_04595 [Paenibacillus hunanensis]|uniref:hypothetical protein n=1 Tax=Paenibacillus hunanensis TaxID=539262 RepID=UPI002A6B1D4B|nr:hypothetical protein [Paenibacillus hunanensis]WPP42240.1 hypothetical protein SK066_04595 [Paenibacillus hunanensis]